MWHKKYFTMESNTCFHILQHTKYLDTKIFFMFQHKNYFHLNFCIISSHEMGDWKNFWLLQTVVFSKCILPKTFCCKTTKHSIVSTQISFYTQKNLSHVSVYNFKLKTCKFFTKNEKLFLGYYTKYRVLPGQIKYFLNIFLW